MSDDLDKEFDRLKGDVEKLADAMGRSAVCMTIFTQNYGKDVKSLLELAVAVMMDKPILLLVTEDVKIPDKMRKIADKIEYHDGTEADMKRAATELLKMVGH